MESVIGKYVLITPEIADALQLLIDDANSFQEDLSSGLSDGLYEEGQDRLDAGGNAVGLIESLLNEPNSITQTAEVA